METRISDAMLPTLYLYNWQGMCLPQKCKILWWGSTFCAHGFVWMIFDWWNQLLGRHEFQLPISKSMAAVVLMNTEILQHKEQPRHFRRWMEAQWSDDPLSRPYSVEWIPFWQDIWFLQYYHPSSSMYCNRSCQKTIFNQGEWFSYCCCFHIFHFC